MIVTRLAAEFEPQDAVWLIWPPYNHKNGFSNYEVTINIIKELVPFVSVMLTCANQEIFEHALNHLPETLKTNPQLRIQILPSTEIWARDMGPNFVETDQQTHAIVDFGFNAWGYSDLSDAGTAIDEQYDVNAAKLTGYPIIKSKIISEAGDRETNGKGTLIVSEHVETERNPGWSLLELEAEFRRVLGVKTVIWLKKGLFEDDHTFLGALPTEKNGKAYTVATTNGHVDEYCRFVNPNTVLLAQIDPDDLHDPIAAENHRRLEENYQILKAAKDQDGNSLNIVRLTLPKTLFDTLSPGDYVYDFISSLDYVDGSIFPKNQSVKVVVAASYLNFLISNNVVLGQKYWSEGRDEILKERDKNAEIVLQSVFPDRKIVMLDAYAINLGGGGIHCISIQQPKFG